MKIVAYVLGENVEKYIQPCLKSLLSFCDYILYLDGKSVDKTIEKVMQLNDERIEIRTIPFEHWSKEANGKQRNNALNIIKEKFKGEKDVFVLRIDADEVVDDNGFRLKELAEYGLKNDIGAFNINMEHFIYNLGLLDNTMNRHYVPLAFFKLTNYISYPEVEHPCLSNIKGRVKDSDICTIFHLRHALQLFDMKERYLNNLEKSNMHNKQFLDAWYKNLIFGTYLVKRLDDIKRLPKQLKEEFLL